MLSPHCKLLKGTFGVIIFTSHNADAFASKDDFLGENFQHGVRASQGIRVCVCVCLLPGANPYTAAAVIGV